MKKEADTPWDKAIRDKLNENLEVLMRVADAVAFSHPSPAQGSREAVPDR